MKNSIFLVQIKSSSILKEGKKALLIPMQFEANDIKGKRKKTIHNALIRDAIKLYPQYTNIEDNPTFSISKMTDKEYDSWNKTNVLNQKSFIGGAN